MPQSGRKVGEGPLTPLRAEKRTQGSELVTFWDESKSKKKVFKCSFKTNPNTCHLIGYWGQKIGVKFSGLGGAAQVPEKRADCEGSVGDVRMMLGSSETSRKDLSDGPRHDPKGWRGGEISWDQWGKGRG